MGNISGVSLSAAQSLNPSSCSPSYTFIPERVCLQMDILLSSVLGELTSRSINFFTSKISRRSLFEVEDHLHKVLLRAQVIIDEAMGRHITNQAMIIQLGMLREAVHRGYYKLDTYICQPNEEEAKDQVMRHSSSLSIVNSVKRLCGLSSRGDLALKELQEMVDKLSSMISDANELVLFLTSYPRLYCQPYSMHLQLANCMFGQQLEAQQVINFLLHQQPNSVGELDVMPIVGPGYVGKSTLVTHVCKDERVRAHFSGILFLHGADFTDDDFATLIDRSKMRHKNCGLNFSQDERLLLVVELVGDLNDNTWNRLYSACKLYAPNISKIIVTSRSDTIVKVGTTNALNLKYPTHEAYWYFFRTLTFGSMDPEMHPRLLHVAMEIAKTLNGSIIGANITSRLLRDNFNVHFWCKTLAFLRGSFQKHVSRFGDHPIDLMHQDRPAHFGRMATRSEDFLVYDPDQRFPDEEVPEIMFQDIIYGSMKPHGKFEVLVWSSLIPPYYNYVLSCEIRELKTVATKRKRSLKDGGTLC